MGPLSRRLTTDATPLALNYDPLTAGQSRPFLSTKSSADSPSYDPRPSTNQKLSTQSESINKPGYDPGSNPYDPDRSPPIGSAATSTTTAIVTMPRMSLLDSGTGLGLPLLLAIEGSILRDVPESNPTGYSLPGRPPIGRTATTQLLSQTVSSRTRLTGPVTARNEHYCLN
jgi:hypothetical protein